MPYGGNVQGVGAASLIYFDKPRRAARSRRIAGAGADPAIAAAPRTVGLRRAEELRAARQRLFERWVEEHPQARATRRSTSRCRCSSARCAICRSPRRISRTMCCSGRRAGAVTSIRTTLDLPPAAPHRARARQLRPRAQQHRHSQRRRAARRLSRHVGARDGRLRRFQFGRDRRPGERHAREALAGLGAEAFHLRARDRSGPDSSAHRAEGCADLIRPVQSRELRRSLRRPDHRDRSADSLAQRSGGVAVGAARAAESLSIPEDRRRLAAWRASATTGSRSRSAAAKSRWRKPRRCTRCSRIAASSRRCAISPTRPRAPGTRLLSEEASFMTLDMLRSAPRPEDPFARNAGACPAAWKTGTSWGFRDAWTAGVFGPYVLVVWVGNFDGHGNPAFVGVQAAAPLFFRVVDAIARTSRKLVEPAFRQPPRLARVDVCSASGDLPNAECPQTVQHLVHPGRLADSRQPGASTRLDRHAHRRASVPAVRSGAHAQRSVRVLADRAAATVRASRHAATSAAAAGRLSARRGRRHAAADHLAGHCRDLHGARADASATRPIPLAANADSEVRRLHWFVDESYVGTSAPGIALAGIRAARASTSCARWTIAAERTAGSWMWRSCRVAEESG